MSTPAPTYGPVQNLVVTPTTSSGVSATWDPPVAGEPDNGGTTTEQVVGVSTPGSALYAQMTQQLTPTITALVTAVEGYSPYGPMRFGYSATQPASQGAVTWLGYADLPAASSPVRGTLTSPVQLTAGVPVWVVGYSTGGGYVRADTSSAGATFTSCTVANSRVNYGFNYNPGSTSVMALRGIADGTLAAYQVAVLSGSTVFTARNLLAGVHTTTFTDLPGGTYTLRVRALQPDSATPADVLAPFTVVTPIVVAGPTATATMFSVDGDLEALQIDRSGDVLTLTLLDTTVTQPGVLRATAGNGPANGTCYVFLDDVQTQTATLDDQGILTSLRIAVSGLSAGAHTASVSATPVAPAASTAFTTLNGVWNPPPPPTPILPGLPEAPGRWVFQSYDLDEFGRLRTLVLPINPSQVKKQFGNAALSSQPMVFGGTIASWEGQAPPATWNWTGHLLDYPQYAEMAFWGQSTQRLYLTDHHGDRYLVKVTQYETTRVRDVERPYHHSYTMTVAVLTGSVGAVLPDIHGAMSYGTREAPRGVAAGAVGGPPVALSSDTFAGIPVGGVTGLTATATLAAAAGGVVSTFVGATATATLLGSAGVVEVGVNGARGQVATSLASAPDGDAYSGQPALVLGQSTGIALDSPAGQSDVEIVAGPEVPIDGSPANGWVNSARGYVLSQEPQGVLAMLDEVPASDKIFYWSFTVSWELGYGPTGTDDPDTWLLDHNDSRYSSGEVLAGSVRSHEYQISAEVGQVLLFVLMSSTGGANDVLVDYLVHTVGEGP